MKKAEFIAFLIAIGIPKAKAEQMAGGVADDFAPAEVIDSAVLLEEWKAQQVALMKNDATIVEEIQKAERAKNLDQIERKIKQTFGLAPEEMKDKKFDEILVIAKSKVSTGDKTTVELQQHLLEAENEVKRLNEVEIPKIKSETESHKKNFDKANKLKSLIPSDPEKLRLPFETAERLIRLDIEEQYDTDINDKGEWVIKQKGTDLLAKTQDGSKFITMDELVTSRLEHHKAIVKSNGAQEGRAKPPVIIEGAENRVKSHAQIKAEKHAETLRANAEIKA